MTQVASLVRSITDTLDEDVLENILLTVEGVKGTSVKFASTKGKEVDVFGVGKKKAVKRVSDKVSIAQKEKILRAFIEGSITVPALARVTGTAIESFEEWAELGISKELFFDVYNTTPSFKDRIDTIYGLCDDINYLHENYINKLAI